jgi:hypothetical protein
LTKQSRCEAIVIEGQHDLRRGSLTSRKTVLGSACAHSEALVRDTQRAGLLR